MGKTKVHFKTDKDWVVRVLCGLAASVVRHTNNAGQVDCLNCLARMKEMDA